MEPRVPWSAAARFMQACEEQHVPSFRNEIGSWTRQGTLLIPAFWRPRQVEPCEFEAYPDRIHR